MPWRPAPPKSHAGRNDQVISDLTDNLFLRHPKRRVLREYGPHFNGFTVLAAKGSRSKTASSATNAFKRPRRSRTRSPMPVMGARATTFPGLQGEIYASRLGGPLPDPFALKGPLTSLVRFFPRPPDSPFRNPFCRDHHSLACSARNATVFR